jgi:hypothetical protein
VLLAAMLVSGERSDSHWLDWDIDAAKDFSARKSPCEFGEAGAQSDWINEGSMKFSSGHFLAGGCLTVLALLLSACTAHEKPSTVETALARIVVFP